MENIDKDWLDTTKAGKSLGLTPNRVRQLIRQGRLERKSRGRRRVYTTRQSIQRFIESSRKSGVIQPADKGALEKHHDDLKEVIETILQNKHDYFWAYLLDKGESRFIIRRQKKVDVTGDFKMMPLGAAPRKPIDTKYPGISRILGEHLPEWYELREHYTKMTDDNRNSSYSVCQQQIGDELRNNEEEQIMMLEEALNEPIFPGRCYICKKYYQL